MIQLIYANNIRGLVKQANSLGLKRDDVISIQQSQGQFYLIYYSSKDE